MASFEGVPAVLGSRPSERDSHLRRADEPLPENVTPSAPKIRTIPHACREISFTYCSGSTPEFFYSSFTDGCMLASENLVQLCNRGRNKFTSKRRCKMSCLSAEEPDPNCLEKPLFSADDIKPSPWYFDGKRCTPWGFPSGLCPSNDSAVFATASACTSRCSDQRHAACSLPRTVNCKYKQLRFPYFADRSSGDGRIRCLSASSSLLKGRLCLDGLNRFDTSRACEDACRKATT
ncbi:hypothetical protein HPB50_020697 [Hyalomma asiaticum]|uniref:Uncharacterized protein n=1 Tax=Hyalomma asiaticum TaxID=266040 RepID=A0ACB7S4R6_HYAAI|nr:hypothetical protein HPB50_020697 [Hyalomma asiaticum]